MPKIETNSNLGILPSGLSHQIGLGFTLTKIEKKDYVFTNFNLTTDEKEIIKNALTFKDYKGFSFLYQMNYRTPISKRLFINWGMRYSLNFSAMVKPFATYNETLNYGVADQYRKNIFSTRLSNAIQFTLGLGFSY
jgi:hypothetical protein